SVAEVVADGSIHVRLSGIREQRREVRRPVEQGDRKAGAHMLFPRFLDFSEVSPKSDASHLSFRRAQRGGIRSPRLRILTPSAQDDNLRQFRFLRGEGSGGGDLAA